MKLFRLKMAGEESKEGGGGGFYTPLTQNIAIEALRPGVPRSAPKK
jgi:hypothetical protein